MQVLKTKLFKPVLGKGYLVRNRLLNIIKDSISLPLLLVFAAAGYGKSVLVSQWLDHIGKSYSWISLDQECNDLRIFLSYLCDSIRPFTADNAEEFYNMLKAPVLPNRSSIIYFVSNTIAGIKKEHVLVFDDYHLISNKNVHRLMNELIDSLSFQHTLVSTYTWKNDSDIG